MRTSGRLFNNPSTPNSAPCAERIPRDFTQVYVQPWDVNLQQPPGSESHLEGAYVGSHGLHLSVLVEDANLAVPTILPDGRPYRPVGGKRFNPSFGMVRTRTFDGQSFCQAGLVNFTGQWRRGLTLQPACTFSLSIDDDSVTFAHTESSTSIGIPVNNVRFNRGLPDFDLRHSFVTNARRLTPKMASRWAGLHRKFRIGGGVSPATVMPLPANHW